jgi:riboflavin transporter FmnP
MKKSTRDLILGGLFLALGIIVPYIFHTTGIAGQVFLPMHIPVIIGGFFLNPGFAAVVGLLTPISSSVITGMPILYPIAIVMAFELMVYGITVSLLKKKLDIYYTLIFSMIFGRLAAALAVFTLQQFIGLKMNYLVYIKGAIITGLPGIVIQLILIPVIVRALKRTLRR